MSDFFPLIVDGSGTPAIKEIPSGDVLDLTGVTVKAVSIDTTLAVTGNTTLGGTLGVTGTITGSLTGNVTGNVSGTAATVTGAAQSSITSLGTLTGLTLGGDISHTAASNFDIKNTIASQNILFHTRASGGSTAEKMRITHDGMVFIENDAGKFKAGASGDLEMYHDGSNSYIADVGTGELILKGTVAAETSAYIKQVALTSSSNAVAWNSAAAANAYHVTTENTTFSAPSNAVEGAIISVELAQGSTPRTIAWNTVFEFAASTAPTVTATANKTDIFSFRYNGSVWQEIGRSQNMAQT